MVGSLAEQSAEGPELSPVMKRWLLSGGAAIYIGIVGLGVVVQGERSEIRRNTYQPDILRYGANEYPVQHQAEVAFLAGPLGDGEDHE